MRTSLVLLHLCIAAFQCKAFLQPVCFLSSQRRRGPPRGLIRPCIAAKTSLQTLVIDGQEEELGVAGKEESNLEVTENEREVQDSVKSEDAKLMAWARKMGICLKHVAVGQEDGIRGMIAQRDISAGDTLIRLPRTSAFCVGDRQPCPFPAAISVR